jgi:hypothetical protein
MIATRTVSRIFADYWGLLVGEDSRTRIDVHVLTLDTQIPYAYGMASISIYSMGAGPLS